VGRYVFTPAVRFRYQHGDIVLGQLPDRLERLAIDVAKRAGGVDFDPVGACLHLPPHLGEHLIARVRDRCQIRQAGFRVDASDVHVPGRDRDRIRRHE